LTAGRFTPTIVDTMLVRLFTLAVVVGILAGATPAVAQPGSVPDAGLAAPTQVGARLETMDARLVKVESKDNWAQVVGVAVVAVCALIYLCVRAQAHKEARSDEATCLSGVFATNAGG
jgi:hypothetical protein